MFCGFFYPVGKGELQSVAVIEKYLDIYVKDMSNQVEAVQDAIDKLDSMLPCSKEKFEGAIKDEVSRFAELVGPASKIHTYVTMAKNEDDSREGGRGNKNHTNITVGSFSDMEKICNYLATNTRHNWGGRVNTIASKINTVLKALEKMQADGVSIDNSVLTAISKSITAVSFVFQDTAELMYHANRIVEKALRAAESRGGRLDDNGVLGTADTGGTGLRKSLMIRTLPIHHQDWLATLAAFCPPGAHHAVKAAPTSAGWRQEPTGAARRPCRPV
jgi:hypothetical protein